MDQSSIKHLPAIVNLQRRAAERLGLSLRVLDEELGYLYEIGDGVRSIVLVGARSPVNRAGSLRLSELKFYAQRVLSERGFRVPDTARCVRRDIFALDRGPDEALRRERASIVAACEFGAARLPAIVKPNGLARGKGVRVVERAEAIEPAIREIFAIDDSALVQRLVDGMDLRVDMIDGELMVAYERVAIRVEGDGSSSLRELLCALDDRFEQPRFAARVGSSPTWRARVDAAGHVLDRPLPRGAVVDLGPVLNLNETARCIVHETLPPTWLDHVASIGRALDLRHFGVDLRVPGGLDTDPRDATVIEINGSPLLTQITAMGHEELAIAAQARVLAAAFADAK